MTNAAEQSSPIDDRVRVASSVRAHYAAAGFSASALAREIGMTQSKMSRRTTAAEPFDIDELSAIAQVLEVDLTDLISGQNLPTRPLRASGGAGARRNIFLLEVGPGRFELPTSTVKSFRFGDDHSAVITPLFSREEHVSPMASISSHFVPVEQEAI